MVEMTKSSFKPSEITINEKRYLLKILSTFLLPALDDLKAFNSMRKVSILNVEVFLVLIYNLALCMRALDHVNLTKRLLNLVCRLGLRDNLQLDDVMSVDEENEDFVPQEITNQIQKDTMDKIDKLLREIEEKEKSTTLKTQKIKWEEDSSDDSDNESFWGDEIDFTNAPKSSLAGFLFGSEEERQGDDMDIDSFQEDLFSNKYHLFKPRTYKEDVLLPEVVLTKGLLNGNTSQHADKRELLVWFQSLVPKKLKDQPVIYSHSKEDYTNMLLGRLEKRVQTYDFSLEFMENFYGK